MPIPKICRIPMGVLDEGETIGSVSYHGIKGLLKFRLIRHNTFGVHSPFTVCEKIASFALRIFVVFPLLTLCATIDLTIWLIKTATICMIVRDPQRHFAHLIAIVALPILSLGVCLAGKSPAILSPVTTRSLLFSLQNLENPLANPLVRQILQEGFRESNEHEIHENAKPMRILPYNENPNNENPGPVIDDLDDQEMDEMPINHDWIQMLLEEKYFDPNDKHARYIGMPYTEIFPYRMVDGVDQVVGPHPLLIEAARTHDWRLFNMFISAKANPNLIYNDYRLEVELEPSNQKKNFQSSILTGMLKFKMRPDVFEKILAIPDLDVNLSADGITPIVIAFLYGQEKCVEQLAKKGAIPYLEDLEQLKQVVNAFNLDSNTAAIHGKEKYTKTLMNAFGGEIYKNNVYFKAILNRHLANGPKQIFFGPGLGVNNVIDLQKSLADFKVYVDKTIKFFKECGKKEV